MTTAKQHEQKTSMIEGQLLEKYTFDCQSVTKMSKIILVNAHEMTFPIDYRTLTT